MGPSVNKIKPRKEAPRAYHGQDELMELSSWEVQVKRLLLDKKCQREVNKEHPGVNLNLGVMSVGKKGILKNCPMKKNKPGNS